MAALVARLWAARTRLGSRRLRREKTLLKVVKGRIEKIVLSLGWRRRVSTRTLNSGRPLLHKPPKPLAAQDGQHGVAPARRPRTGRALDPAKISRETRIEAPFRPRDHNGAIDGPQHVEVVDRITQRDGGEQPALGSVEGSERANRTPLVRRPREDVATVLGPHPQAARLRRPMQRPGPVAVPIED